jgi:glycerol-3-phosphate dehydrogenase
MLDVCIVGGGVIGTAISRELSRYQLKVRVVERNEDVATETTKANSGIVHGGYDAAHGKLKGFFSAKGNAMYPQLEEELHFGFRQTGSFVVAFNENQEPELDRLLENGIKNGARGLEIISGDRAREMEPHLNQTVTKALYCSTAGVTSPYELAVALAENAAKNGVEYSFYTEVNGIEKVEDHFVLHTNKGPIEAKVVINAAGLYADRISAMIGEDDFTINPRQGQYVLLDKDQAFMTDTVIFQAPENGSKGVLVTPTVHHNILVGPNSDYIDEKNDVATTSDVISKILKAGSKSIDAINTRKVIRSFSGNRASSDRGDFIIGETNVKGFVNVAGIESPGLTSAPAIAVHVADLLKEMGLELTADPNFDPTRKPYKRIADMQAEELNNLIAEEPAYGRVICRCESISEGEIVDAIHRGLPITSVDAVKKRTRAGMGRCQGGFCVPRVMEIISRETGLSMEEITKQGEGSYLLTKRSKDALEKGGQDA